MLKGSSANKGKKKAIRKTKKKEDDDYNDQEIWAKVAEIWEKNQLNKEDSLTLTNAFPYIHEYMLSIGIDPAAEGNDEEVQKIFDEIDEDNNGTIEREEMYNHLKRTKNVSKLNDKRKSTETEQDKPKTKYDLALWKKV